MAIEWQPIDAMPKDRKDGRDMLLWEERGAATASWSGGAWDTCYESIEGGTITLSDVTFWADINRPGDSLEPRADPMDEVNDLIARNGIRLRQP
ncbi:hypothetical protein [Novosphingobium sp. AP12]|uniref:hypothetical protein n=1 Tax=Novosphingobium sp. AP12 TaxID=1144305 RepID=UPI00027205D3|nr:hypothetical protein [Novosphingobium sp. AP12]EJL23951.1 hypothetical protein PMI02_03871 [Novosphingobium sp. AP12]